jgi:hypothetical protein
MPLKLLVENCYLSNQLKQMITKILFRLNMSLPRMFKETNLLKMLRLKLESDNLQMTN